MTPRPVDVDPADPRAVEAMRCYFRELDERFPHGFDPGDALTVGLETMRAPGGTFLLALADDGTVLGCGGLQPIDRDTAEIKRMWVAPEARGRGVARLLLGALEDAARARGHALVQLDTNGVLHEAIAMYRRHGYRDVDRYNDNPFAELWFEKDLGAGSGQPGTDA